MSTYVLIHGAWHGGWCWKYVIPLLEKEGHRVIAPDLPGMVKTKNLSLKLPCEPTLIVYAKFLMSSLIRLFWWGIAWEGW